MQYIKERRSGYSISSQCPLSDDDVKRLVLDCVKHTPSMFNMQSTRAVILFGDAHRRLWKLIAESLPADTLEKRPNVAHQLYDKVQHKLDNLAGGHGTVLFFEDPQVIAETAEQYPAYSKNFETWSKQSSAIAQQNVWLALGEAAPTVGVSLQHYYPDRQTLQDEWGIPIGWDMTGQMPFGAATRPPWDKTYRPDDVLVRSIG